LRCVSRAMGDCPPPAFFFVFPSIDGKDAGRTGYTTR
jgi:hypothetical protein